MEKKELDLPGTEVLTPQEKKEIQMKTAWNGEFFQGFEELSVNEGTAIVGGESLWYWVGYGVGVLGYTITHLNSNQSSGQQLTNVALG